MSPPLALLLGALCVILFLSFRFSIFEFRSFSSSHTHQSSPNNISSPQLPYDIHAAPKTQYRSYSPPTFPVAPPAPPETQNAPPPPAAASSPRRHAGTSPPHPK